MNKYFWPLSYNGYPPSNEQAQIVVPTAPATAGGPLCPSCNGQFALGQRAMLTVSMVEDGRTDFVAVHEVCF